MAVKASDQITMTDLTDVKSVCRYYLLQSSTLAVPAKPTTNPPSSSWSKTEPTYTAGSTNSLYFTDLTVFSNDTFSYSDVSLSSSYEAAKTAYNKAVEAAKTATNYIDYSETNGLQVGNKQSGSWSGTRTQQTASAFNILGAAGEVLASYGAALVELGKNAANAVIKLCAGAGKIEVVDNEKFGGDTLTIDSSRINLKGTHSSGMDCNVEGGLLSVDGYREDYEAKAWNRINCYVEPAGLGTGAANVRIGAAYTHSTNGVEDTNEESAITITESNINIRASQEFGVEATNINLNADAVTVNGGALFVIRTSRKDNISVSANGNTSGVEVDITLEGYTPIGIACVALNNASSSGKSVSYVNIYTNYFKQYEDGSWVYYCSIHNFNASNAAKIRIEPTILYIRNEMVGNLYEHLTAVDV